MFISFSPGWIFWSQQTYTHIFGKSTFLHYSVDQNVHTRTPPYSLRLPYETGVYFEGGFPENIISQRSLSEVIDPAYGPNKEYAVAGTHRK